MKDDKLHIPPTPFERVVEAMNGACDLVEKTLQQKHIAENLERFDVARDLRQCADHVRIARFFLTEALRKAAKAPEDV